MRPRQASGAMVCFDLRTVPSIGRRRAVLAVLKGTGGLLRGLTLIRAKRISRSFARLEDRRIIQRTLASSAPAPSPDALFHQ